MSISEQTIQRVKDSTDILEVIQSYGVDLKKDGASYKGRCPFHNEKSPSFDVNPTKQLFKCFGCPAAGDVINFVKLKEDCTFADAVTKLAHRRGISVEDDQSYGGSGSRRERTSRKASPASVKASKAPAEPLPPFDWDPCVAAFTPDHIAKLAQWRGYSIDFVEWMHREKIVGLFRDRIAIPVHDKNGVVVKCHYREKNGSWRYFPAEGETAPLVIGNPKEAGYVLAFESQWDAFAVLDQLGHHEDPSAYAAIITRGATSNTDFSDHQAPTITAIPQNDPEKKRNLKTGLTPAEDWLQKIKASRPKGSRFVVGEVPPEWKDANDWIRDGKPGPAVIRQQLVDRAKSPLLASSWTVGELFVHETADDPNAIIGYKRRFLGRGSSMIVTGPAGIGKSTLIASMAIHHAAGVAWHGIAVRHPLRTIVIQAENDKGDLAEMIQGAAKSMRMLGPEAQKLIGRNLTFMRLTDKIGEDFCRHLEEVILETGAEVIYVDPLLAYIGGDISKQEVVSEFFRVWLQPILNRTGVILVFVHHTGKTSDQAGSRKSWSLSDYGYAGIGSSELTNWPRAMITILPVPGEEKIYKFMIPKRGARAGLLNYEGEVSEVMYIRHGNPSEGQTWVQVPCPDKDEDAETKERRRKVSQIIDITGYLQFLPKTCSHADAVGLLRSHANLDFNSAKETLHKLKKLGRIDIEQGVVIKNEVMETQRFF